MAEMQGTNRKPQAYSCNKHIVLCAQVNKSYDQTQSHMAKQYIPPF